MADASNWYYTLSGSETTGPVDLGELARLVSEGKITGATAVWHASFGQQWRRADSVPELRRAFAGAESARCKVVSRTPFETVPVLGAVREAFRQTVAVLLRRPSFLLWIGLAFCTWMASANALVNVADTKTLFDMMGKGANLAVSLAESTRIGLEKVFLPKVSGAWIALVLMYSMITAYVCVKGRLMLLHKVYSPGDPIGHSWRHTVGKTRSLSLFYMLVESAVNFDLATCLYHFFVSAGFGKDGVGTAQALLDALRRPESAKWLVLGLALFLVLKFVRSFAFHFVEPLVYRFSLPVFSAFAMALRNAGANPGAFLRYYLFVFAFRAAYYVVAASLLALCGLLLGGASVSPAAMTGGFPLLLVIVLGRLVFLPPDYFIRVLATRFLKQSPSQAK